MPNAEWAGHESDSVSCTNQNPQITHILLHSEPLFSKLAPVEASLTFSEAAVNDRWWARRNWCLRHGVDLHLLSITFNQQVILLASFKCCSTSPPNGLSSAERNSSQPLTRVCPCAGRRNPGRCPLLESTRRALRKWKKGIRGCRKHGTFWSYWRRWRVGPPAFSAICHTTEGTNFLGPAKSTLRRII